EGRGVPRSAARRRAAAGPRRLDRALRRLGRQPARAHRGKIDLASTIRGMAGPERWDIFCRVVDNYGDVGVSWRLARQVAREHAKRARLWLHHLPVLAPLRPEIDT